VIAGFDAAARRGVVVLSNSDAEVTDDIGLHLADPRAPLQSITPRVEIELESAALEPFTGQYELQPGMVFDIELRDNTLHARLTDQGWLPIYPEALDKFFYKAIDAQLVFQRDDEGAVTGVTLHQGGMQLTAPRLSPSP
jgi:D-alanyl-D-alanine-carboxypeptidase/D-alanyl-D-alanine-endopeptidase